MMDKSMWLTFLCGILLCKSKKFSFFFLFFLLLYLTYLSIYHPVLSCPVYTNSFCPILAYSVYYPISYAIISYPLSYYVQKYHVQSNYFQFYHSNSYIIHVLFSTLSYPIQSYSILGCGLSLSFPIPSCPTLHSKSSPTLPPILSFSLSYYILSSPDLSCRVMFCHILCI